MSWWEFGVFLRRHPGQYAREVAHRMALEATPPEERAVGGRADALPIDELNTFLGWD